MSERYMLGTCWNCFAQVWSDAPGMDGVVSLSNGLCRNCNDKTSDRLLVHMGADFCNKLSWHRLISSAVREGIEKSEKVW